MKATTVLETLDICFHFFHYEYTITKYLFKQESLEVFIN